MTINDGFGEQLSPEQMEQEIRDREKLLRLKAGERVSDPNVWEDVLAEGRIVIWEVLQKRPQAPRPYVSAAMSMRMQEVAVRGTWTGYESHRGKPTDPIRRNDRDSFDDPEFYGDLAAPDALDAVMLAYHEGELLQALGGLTQAHREYVVLRFWGGLTNAEIAARRGNTKGYESMQWERSIKPVLRTALAHMTVA